MNWRVTTLILIALVGGFAVLFAIVTRPIAAPHHEVYVNGTVLTMDADNAIAEAVSVRDGVIEAVGGSEAMLAAATDDTQVINLRGRTLMPGFVDAHGHFPGSGQTVFSVDLNSPPIGDVTDIEQLLARLTDFAMQRAGGWVVGHGYDDTLLREKRHPTRDDLDRVSRDRPVAVVHVSGHLAVVNTAALEVLGIDESTPDPEGGGDRT
jgi:predicted amidohydrolase YtcJ